ncbi:hypothetical protein F511_30053 [Dorcoceras hygrometricum]|uniref:Uncharacterized protein n=1 Tax=Dorcoceras hygrometricum TaxID=472368 RepID=A0A2Z7BQF6_9LAMI|nr:hypothetical protein F511_30053 [Dorcoceras hygrometricum]
MAIDVYSEISSPVISPRISFSLDLKESDFIPVNVQTNQLNLNPTIDFDCRKAPHVSHQISSADELFANGKILPVQIKRMDQTLQSEPKSTPKAPEIVENATDNTKKKRLIEYLSTSFDPDEEETTTTITTTKPFWQFKRSASLNCDTGGRGTRGLLRSLDFFTRSNSTGSVRKQVPKQNSSKESSNPDSTPLFHHSPSSSKRPAILKKSGTRSCNNNGIRVAPVLNIPTAYISKGTASLFGIGSLFSSKKSRKKKK